MLVEDASWVGRAALVAVPSDLSQRLHDEEIMTTMRLRTLVPDKNPYCVPDVEATSHQASTPKVAKALQGGKSHAITGSPLSWPMPPGRYLGDTLRLSLSSLRRFDRMIRSLSGADITTSNSTVVTNVTQIRWSLTSVLHP